MISLSNKARFNLEGAVLKASGQTVGQAELLLPQGLEGVSFETLKIVEFPYQI
jgi:hypothetical protein